MKNFFLALICSVIFLQCSKKSVPVSQNQKTEIRTTDPATRPIFDSIHYPAAEAVRIDTNSFRIKIAELSKTIEADSVNAQAFAARGDLKNFSGDVKGACDDWKKAKDLGMKNMDEIIRKNCK
jgi:hypothetical protein